MPGLQVHGVDEAERRLQPEVLAPEVDERNLRRVIAALCIETRVGHIDIMKEHALPRWQSMATAHLPEKITRREYAILLGHQAYKRQATSAKSGKQANMRQGTAAVAPSPGARRPATPIRSRGSGSSGTTRGTEPSRSTLTNSPGGRRPSVQPGSERAGATAIVEGHMASPADSTTVTQQ